MDDRLKQRIRDADPLTAAEGLLPDAARLDTIKERIMQTEPAPARSAFRPRAIGVTAMMVGALTLVLVVGTLVRPTSSALAWAPTPTAVSDAQRGDAAKACAAGLPPAGGTSPETRVGTVPGPGGGQTEMSTGSSTENGDGSGTTVSGSATISGGTTGSGPVTTGGNGTMPDLPPFPTELPPLASLELHGSGGVAVFTDGKVTAYCLLVKQGDDLISGGLMFPDLGGGVAAGIGMASVVTAQGQGPSSATVVAGGKDGFMIVAMTTSYADQSIGVIAGTAPAGAASIKVVGGPADGATATVTKGTFALWTPGVLAGQGIKVVALEANGTEIGSQTFDPAPGAPVVTETTKP